MSLKNELESELHIPIRVRAGAPGSLRVIVNGEQIYSKQQERRSPDAAAMVKVIREKIGTPTPSG